jgi:hypothetical protein
VPAAWSEPVNIIPKSNAWVKRKPSLHPDKSEEATSVKSVTITLSEAKELIARTEAGAKQENLLGVIMPNGKPLKDCTGEYLGQLGQAMQELGFRLGVD